MADLEAAMALKGPVEPGTISASGLGGLGLEGMIGTDSTGGMPVSLTGEG